MLFVRLDDTILECSMDNEYVIVRIGNIDFSPFYRTYKTDYLFIDCLINELLSFSNDVIITDDIYDILGDEL